MTLTEKQIQEGIQSVIQDLEKFPHSAVVINDYSAFDGLLGEDYMVIIENSDNFTAMQPGAVPNNNFTIPVTLLIRFLGTDKETLDALRDRREEIKATFNDLTGNRTLGSGCHIAGINSTSGVLPWFAEGVDPNDRGTFPLFIFQDIAFEVEQF